MREPGFVHSRLKAKMKIEKKLGINARGAAGENWSGKNLNQKEEANKW